jgi:hypothetical protein
MEIKFRPLPASTLARQVAPGQAPTEDGQSFVEVVESLTAADQTPEKDANAGRNQEKQPQNPSFGGPDESAEDAANTPPGQEPETTIDNPNPQFPDKADPQGKSLGARLDLTA